VTKYKDLLSLKRETKSPFYKFILHTINESSLIFEIPFPFVRKKIIWHPINLRRLALVTSSPLLLNNIPQNIRVILFN